MKFQGNKFSVPLVLVFFALRAHGAVLDFETLNGALPVEGNAISNQFEPYYGLTFRRADGGHPVFAKKGAPQTAFNVSNVTPH